MSYYLEIALLLTALAFFSIVSVKKKSLDWAGVLIANVVGLSIFYFGGLQFFFIAVLFFIVAEGGTRFAASKKPVPHGRRTIGNIFGNSGVAVIALLLGYPIAFFGAMAAALADTLSSELGMLSPTKPVLITTLEQVPVGTNGGITGLGMWSALAGSLVIATIHFVLYQNFYIFMVLVLAGFFGSAVDSFFGAVFERKKLFGNTEVNFLGSSAGALLAYVLWLFL
ncbi:MAG: hypothetical protein CL943_01350 [Candidatus Diapherotrites archaeon]|uniref:DUF92 domain-containing protein n=1 Tax=Candidatus Iainarchaeum sp. TaxID=3101447 RepID=A0A2D6M0J1_9ARCH|nr:hypothetical protein [Candidatus Diapherotrites archaeon]|tara:strand:+ start:1358 stop:2032 length:675 start_codon:yes stop_codon:yes gene_type:complete